MSNNEFDKIEKTIGEILKPSFEGAPEPRQRPAVTLVGPDAPLPVEAAPAPPQAAPELPQAAPLLTVTERLEMLVAQNGEMRTLVAEASVAMEQHVTERAADIQGFVAMRLDAIEAKLDAVLTILR